MVLKTEFYLINACKCINIKIKLIYGFKIDNFIKKKPIYFNNFAVPIRDLIETGGKRV